MRTLQRRLVLVAAAAVAVGALAALPTGAKASLVGDPFTLTSQTVFICNPSCIDNKTVIDPGAEFTRGDESGIGTFFNDFDSASFIDVGASDITFFFDFGHTGTYDFTNLDWTDMPGSITGVSLATAAQFPAGFGTLASLNLSSTANSVQAQVACGAFSGTTNCAAPGGTLFRVNITAVHVVPLPAALPLFLSALAGLGFVGWRRRQAGA